LTLALFCLEAKENGQICIHFEAELWLHIAVTNVFFAQGNPTSMQKMLGLWISEQAVALHHILTISSVFTMLAALAWFHPLG